MLAVSNPDDKRIKKNKGGQGDCNHKKSFPLFFFAPCTDGQPSSSLLVFSARVSPRAVSDGDAFLGARS